MTVIRRKNYVHDGLTEWNGVKLIDIESPKQKSFEAIVHTFKAVNKAKQLGADVLHIHAIGPALLVPYAKMLGLKWCLPTMGRTMIVTNGDYGQNGFEMGRADGMPVCG